jgi:hypothetical protein
MIASAEVRSPIVEVSAQVSAWLDREMDRLSAAPDEAPLVNAG